MRRRRPEQDVRGQYDGYRQIDGVAPDSSTETYVALRLEIDNWRWAGRPVLHPHRQATAGQADRAAPGVQAPARACTSSSSATSAAAAEPDRVQDRSEHRHPDDPRRPSRRRAGPDRDQARHGVRAGGRRGRHALRGAAARRARRRRTPISRARTTSRRRGGSCSRCSTRRRRCTRTRPGTWGPERGQAARRRVRRLARPWVPTD